MQKLETTIKCSEHLGSFINQFIERKTSFVVLYNLGIESIVMHPLLVYRLIEHYLSDPSHTPYLQHNHINNGYKFFGYDVIQSRDIAEDEVKLIIE